MAEVAFKLTKTKDELKLFATVHVSENYIIGSLELNQLKQLFSDIPEVHEGVLKNIFEELKPGANLEARRLAYSIDGNAPASRRAQRNDDLAPSLQQTRMDRGTQYI